VSGGSPKAIASLYGEDPAFEERLQRFVVDLGGRIDACQDAELEGDFARLRSLALAFADESQELGYPLLAEAARSVASACVSAHGDLVRKSLVDLTDISQQVRRGHRGAA
jgi:hypothetical protein